ncbi:MAG: AAA family ATPase, partial [Chloroflexi bacterium]|nr:AAA family ATPase [Chloroflexota bacterium]
MDEPLRESPRLKALDLQGYKTFAGRAEFQFGRTITAIVGPNGSGKSNIADAIRWVLGEQSYGLLRGKKTEDMIFAGSEARPRASMASATITFDNADGWLPIEFSEVTVSRRAYRDAQNKYFLNNQRVRLRDVFELLSETGLAQRTYTIIGQGLVDAVLALKAEERRRLFEEAAGIGLYRSRREEALRRLEATRHNLERVQDILAELLPRVRSLERQARRAHEYEQVRDDLKSALRTWYGFHWFRVQKQVTEAHAEAGKEGQRRDDLRAEQEGVDGELLQVRGRIESLRADLHAFSQRISARFAERETLGRRVAVAQERLRGLAEQDGLAAAETAVLETERDELTLRLAAAREEIAGRQQTLFAAEEEFHRLQGPADLQDLDREALQERMPAARARLGTAIERRSAWRSELAQADARLQSLSAQAAETRLGREAAQAAASASRDQVASQQRAVAEAGRALQTSRDAERAVREEVMALEHSLTEAQEGLRVAESRLAALDARRSVLRDETRQQKLARTRLEQALQDGELSGSIGRLSAHLHPDEALRAAILAALGESAQGFVFSESQGVDDALAWLADGPRNGRVSLLPQAMNGTPPAAISAAGGDCIGNAADLARPDDDVKVAATHLLANTLIVETREQARRLMTDLPAGSRVVTRAGEVFSSTGEVLAGIAEEDRPSEGLAKVEAEVEQAESVRAEKAALLDGLQRDLEAARLRLAEATRTVEDAVGLDRAASLRLEHATLELQAKEAQLESLSAGLLRLSQDVERAEQDRGLTEERGLSHEAEEREAQAEVDAL